MLETGLKLSCPMHNSGDAFSDGHCIGGTGRMPVPPLLPEMFHRIHEMEHQFIRMKIPRSGHIMQS